MPKLHSLCVKPSLFALTASLSPIAHVEWGGGAHSAPAWNPPDPTPPGERRAQTCPSAIFGSRLGKEEVLAQGFLSLAAGAEEVTKADEN